MEPIGEEDDDFQEASNMVASSSYDPSASNMSEQQLVKLREVPAFDGIVMWLFFIQSARPPTDTDAAHI